MTKIGDRAVIKKLQTKSNHNTQITISGTLALKFFKSSIDSCKGFFSMAIKGIIKFLSRSHISSNAENNNFLIVLLFSELFVQL